MKKIPAAAAVLATGLMLGCGAQAYQTNYPPTQATMDRFLAGANKLGCTFKKNRPLGWGVGMRRAYVTCPPDRKVLIEADDRSTGDASHVTSIACEGKLGGDKAACNSFVDAIWSAAQ